MDFLGLFEMIHIYRVTRLLTKECESKGELLKRRAKIYALESSLGRKVLNGLES